MQTIQLGRTHPKADKQAIFMPFQYCHLLLFLPVVPPAGAVTAMPIFHMLPPGSTGRAGLYNDEVPATTATT